MKSILRYLIVVALQLAASMLFIVAFKHAFGYRLMIIPLHGVLVLAVNVLLVAAAGLCIQLRFGARWLAVSLHAATTFAIVFVYGVDWVANRVWGANISIKVIFAYLGQLHALLDALPVSPWWICGPVFFVALATVAIYAALSGTILRGLEEMFLPGRPASFLKNWKRAVVSLCVFLVAAGGFHAFLARSLSWRGQFWYGEPLMGLFFSKPHPSLEETPRSRSIAQEAQRVRANYPKNIPFEKKNVFIIMSDSLRASHMQVYGYARPTTPFLASLLAEGRLKKVALATSTCPETACGLISTIASRNYVDFSFHNLKLYDLLKDLGYHTYFIGGGDHTNFHGTRDALGHHLDLFFDGGASERYAMNDDNVVLEGLERVPEYDGTPAFFFFFLMSTHQTGVKLDEYATYKPDRIAGQDPWTAFEDPGALEALVNHYDNGVVQADAFVQKILASLERKGYLADALGVVMADHGEGLGEKNHFLHCTHLYEDFIGIPMLFYDSPEVSYANLDYGTQIDVAPTLVDRLGLPVPECWEGISLLEPAAPRYTLHTTLGTMPRRAAIYRTDGAIYKYVRSDPKDTAGPKEELFELRSDPKEEHNLIDSADGALVNELRRRVVEKYDNWQE